MTTNYKPQKEIYGLFLPEDETSNEPVTEGWFFLTENYKADLSFSLKIYNLDNNGQN